MKAPQDFSGLKQGIIDCMSLAFETDGFSPLVGRIFAYLLFSAEPVSLQELAAQLGVTKAAVSVQVRTLEKHMMCQKLPTTSDRKDYYYISDEFSLNLVQNGIEKMKHVLRQIEGTIQSFQRLDRIEVQERPAFDASKRRFMEMQALYQMFLERLDGLEEEWNVRREQLFPEGG